MAHEPQNLANAAIIIAAIFFMVETGFSWWLLALIGWGLATWGHWSQTEDQKELVRLGIKQTEANIQNINAATAIAVANTKIIMRNLGR